MSGIDLIRDNHGESRVLEDNVRAPSGVSYVMTNRRAISAALPETIAEHRIRPVTAYPQKLLAALRAAAPAGVTDPTVVVLTPGVYNGAYFEHALLARTMGVELVEGRDLECRRGRVMMRTTSGLAPVHVIYRRVDDEFLDPVHFRADSVLGCPGMIDAARAGNVTLANAVGNGVADDKLVYTYLSDIIRYYLSEEPILKNVDTWRCGEPDHREEVLDRLDELVLKPVDGSGGKATVIGPRATPGELDELRTKVLADPRSWIAQPVVQLSTVPTFVDGEPGPRHVDLRPFAVNDGNKVWVLPGGLTRVALAKGELIAGGRHARRAGDLPRPALDHGSRESLPEHVDLNHVLTALAYDTSSPVSIVSALGVARESARRARETLSVPLGEVINTTYRAIPSGRFGAHQPPGVFQWVRERTALINGTADTTMTRDEGWQFLVLGRCVEGADMTSPLLAASSLTSSSRAPWPNTLRACGAYEAFLRTYRGVETERAAAEFLLLDRLFRRSVVFSLDRAECCLANLESSGQRAGVQNDAQRLIGRTRTELEYRSLTDVLTDLPAETERLQLTCGLAIEAVTKRFFAGAEARAWYGQGA